jgi:hypothetical protein
MPGLLQNLRGSSGTLSKSAAEDDIELWVRNQDYLLGGASNHTPTALSKEWSGQGTDPLGPW